MIAINPDNATREVFGNIAPWMQVVFFTMIAVSIGWLLWQLWARAVLWRKGQKGGFERGWRVWLQRGPRFAAGPERRHEKTPRAFLHLPRLLCVLGLTNRHAAFFRCPPRGPVLHPRPVLLHY